MTPSTRGDLGLADPDLYEEPACGNAALGGGLLLPIRQRQKQACRLATRRAAKEASRYGAIEGWSSRISRRSRDPQSFAGCPPMSGS